MYTLIRVGERTEWHITPNFGTYDSLCGLEGDDPHPAVDAETLASTNTTQVITCIECLAIVNRVKQYIADQTQYG